jgi:hypothetical protein
MALHQQDRQPTEPEARGSEWIASYVYPIAGAVGIAAYILSQIFD